MFVMRDANFGNFLNLKLTFKHDKIIYNSIFSLKVEAELSPELKLKLKPIVQKFSTLAQNKLTLTPLMTHHIDTGDAPPFRMRQYPLSPALMRQLNSELDRMLEDGVISPSNSPWCSPVLMVQKKSGDYRFCFDGRRLNSVTVQDSYPLPRIDTILSKLGNAKFFTTIDLKSAFWQIPLDEESKPKTACAVPG